MTAPLTPEALVERDDALTPEELAEILADDPHHPPRPAPQPIPVRKRYYLTECEHCGWVGSSEQCGDGGGPDYDDVICPVCCSSMLGDGPNEANAAKHGEAVYQRIVAAEAALATATAEAARLRAEVEAKDRAILLLLPFVDYAAGEGLAFVETEDGEHPEMDAADIMAATAKALGLELGSDAYLALLPAGYDAIRAARAATAREG